MARFTTHSNELATPRATALAPLSQRDVGDHACGPGWYESSRDLRRGLDVHEGVPNDAMPGEWPGASLPC